MRWRAGIVIAAVASAAALLAGCAPAVELPPGPTRAELESMQKQSSDNWWRSMFPDQEPPVVRRIQYVSTDEQGPAVERCVEDSITLNSTSQELAAWVCYQRFPLDLTDPVFTGSVLSPAQLEYLYSYFIGRTVPCLRSNGYRVNDQPDHDSFMSRSVGFPAWNPYYSMAPSPHLPSERAIVIALCPPPFAADMLVPEEPTF